MRTQTEVAIDLNPHYLQEVLRILSLYVPDVEVRAFGSRVKWTAKAYSDLDLALMTQRPLSLEQEALLREAFDESTLPFKVDFVDWASTSKTFQNIISADSVLIRPASRHASDEKWLVMPLEEALDALLDYRGKTPEKTSFGVPLITAKIVKNGSIEPATEFIAHEKYSEWMTRGLPRVGDVVLTTEAPLGQVAQLHTDHVALAQRIVALRGKAGVLDNNYLRYLLQADEMQEQLAARATGTTVLGIKQSELRKIVVRLPSLERQRAAAAMLASLDDRITLLRETNATLEAIAQALFKSWFVDFDPVRAKMAGRAPEGMDEATAALFPDAFEETALGLVPKGWDATTLGEATSQHGGAIQTGPFGSQLHASDYAEDGTPVAMPKDIADRRINTASVARVSAEHVARLSRHQLAVGDIVFSRRGDVERHALITSHEVGWLCGTGCLLVRPGPQWRWSAYLSMLLDAPQAKSWLVQHAVGATMPNLNTGILASVPLVLPPSGILDSFEQVTMALEERRSENLAMTHSLAALRDTLLPRLISGQLRLPEAQAQLEEALA